MPDKPSSEPARRFGLPRPAHLSTRVRGMIQATAIVLIMGAVVVLISSFIINDMKNRLVRVAHEEVRSSVEYAAAEIEEVVREFETTSGRQIESLSEIANNPSVKAQLRIMSRATGSLVMSAMIDSEGNCVYQHYGDRQMMDNCPIRQGNSGIIPESDVAGGLTWELELRDYPVGATPERVAVTSNGRTLGHIEYLIEEGLTLSRLDPISTQITTSLSWMAALATLCFGAAMLLINRIWGRHLELEKHHRDAQHMAHIGTMASGLAHEIRNPLHAMNLHLESVREELEDPRENSGVIAARTVSNVQRQITNLNGILTHFMAYAMPTEMESEPVRLHCVIADVVHLLTPELDRLGVTLERDVPEEAWIMGDHTAVSQVLTNVVLNAAQAVAGREERRIAIGARLDDSGRWVLTLDDTGPGLPEGAEQSIFDVFVSNRPGGSGFGLAIARRLMEQHGGSITGMTRKEGGARFTLDFPAAAPPPKKKASAGASQQVEASGQLTVG